jgi:hypothetical protein
MKNIYLNKIERRNSAKNKEGIYYPGIWRELVRLSIKKDQLIKRKELKWTKRL